MLAHGLKRIRIKREKINQLHEKHNDIVRKLENMMNEKQKNIYCERYNSLSALSSSMVSSPWLESWKSNNPYPNHHFSTSYSKLYQSNHLIDLQNSQETITSSANIDDSHRGHLNPSFVQKIHDITMQVFNISPSSPESLSSFYNMDVHKRKYSIQQSTPYITSLQTIFSFDDDLRTENQKGAYNLSFQHRMFSTRPSPDVDQNLSLSSPPPLPPKNQPPSSLDATKHQPNDLSKGNMTTNASNIASNTSNKTATAATSGSMSSSNYSKKIQAAIRSATKAIVNFIVSTPGVLWFYLTHPKDFQKKMRELKDLAKKEAHHYYMGSKLLAADVRTARHMLLRTLQGSPLTRRERKQLLRTTADLFRLVPMSMFLLIPFMEFALPFALKIFPNMLPSTFQDSLKAEENMKRELKTRIAMAGFFQETLQSLAKEQKKRISKSKSKDESEEVNETTEEEETAKSFLTFLEKSRSGEAMPPDLIIKYAKYFEDDLTLDNMSRMQLINMCRYMGIPPYGADSLLRFQLRHRVKTLKEDDQRILWDGIESLTKMELREACQERGMRSIGLSKSAYKMALQQWLDLSVVKHVPIALLIMSRTFFLREEMENMTSVTSYTDDSKAVSSIADAISGLEKEVVNEVVLDVAAKSLEDHKDPEVVKIKLEVLEQQNELIKEEYQEREAKKKKKEEEEASIVTSTESKVEEVTITAEKEKQFETKDDISTLDEKEESTKELVEEEKEKQKMKAKSDTGTKDDKEMTAKDEEENMEDDTRFDDEDEKELSAEEIEAISQLLSPNAVISEREELERIKAAMASTAEPENYDDGDTESDEDLESKDVIPSASTPSSVISETITEQPEPDTLDSKKPLESDVTESIEESDKKAAKIISDMDEEVAKESEASTTIDFEKSEIVESSEEDDTEEPVVETKLDKSIARLQSKVDDMVGKIEIQLSDVEAKIGNKMHLLDKDNDGLLTNEEIADVLQQVLKRELSSDEAMAIAADMDGNQDGVMTVKEMLIWIETNKLVKLAADGRYAELDSAIANKASKLKEENEDKVK